jgi:hypothetical protein
MKKPPVLALLALLALLPFAQAMAQTPPVAQTTAQFLATLSAGPAQTPNDLAPAPSFMASCTSSAQCPAGQLCCNACGAPPPNGTSCLACLTPIRGHCPLIP